MKTKISNNILTNSNQNKQSPKESIWHKFHSRWWNLYCNLNNHSVSLPSASSARDSYNHSALRKRVINSFANFYSTYQIIFSNVIQNTSKSYLFKNLTLTKRRVNIVMQRLLSLNNFSFDLILFPELHSCWKKCHWTDNVISKDWSNHDRNNCRCFAQKKHWKCKRIFHIHGWQLNALTLPNSLEMKVNYFLEEIEDKDTRLCYNMKDWKNFYQYPKLYRSTGFNFRKKWYLSLNSEKFLKDKEKIKKLNASYYRRRKSSVLVTNVYGNITLKKKRVLISAKSRLKSQLKKISGREYEEKSKLIEKIKDLQFKLAIL